MAVFTGVMLLGLPIFPIIAKTLAAAFPGVFKIATALFLPIALIALVLGIRQLSGKQSRVFFMYIVLLCTGFGILTRVMTITPLEQFHAVEYAVLAALVYRAPAREVDLRSRCLTALTYTCLIGVVDEAIQYLLPNRVFDPRDIALNWGAGCFGVLLSGLVHGRRKQEPRQNEVRRAMR